ncbi:hypothetical protein ACW6QP_13890 [Salegentibacter sp. HM20]
MPRYYVNTNSQSNGDHEVHEDSYCSNAPTPQNRKDLGYHSDCHSAVREAKRTYSQSNGCFYCCNPCHTS